MKKTGGEGRLSLLSLQHYVSFNATVILLLDGIRLLELTFSVGVSLVVDIS